MTARVAQGEDGFPLGNLHEDTGGMRLQYSGVNIGDVGWAQIAVSRELLRNKAQIGYGFKHTWNCSRVGLAVSGQADATIKGAAIETALAVQNADLVLLNDNGLPSFKYVQTADTLSGVRCTNLEWSDRPGAQHATYLEFSCRFEWETRFPSSAGLLMDFTETITVSGGTAIYVKFDTLNAGPIIQQTVPTTGYMVVQEGSASGVSDWPVSDIVAPPLTSLGYQFDRTVGRTSPERIGNGYSDFRVRWRYQFVSATLPVGNPHIWV